MGIVIRLVYVGVVVNGIAGCGGQPPSQDRNLQAPAPSHAIVDSKTSLPVSVTLAVSHEKGLLGAPLPEGARLLERHPGDPASSRDPSERYSLSASADELAAFFDRAMPMVGWTKQGTSTSTALIFRKGPLMLGVIINSNGGAFSLMGS